MDAEARAIAVSLETQAIQLLVEDKPGVLMRVIGIITAKGFNVQSLSVKPDSEQAGMARILVVAEVELHLRQRVVKEMNRLVQVLAAVDVSEEAKPELD